MDGIHQTVTHIRRKSSVRSVGDGTSCPQLFLEGLRFWMPAVLEAYGPGGPTVLGLQHRDSSHYITQRASRLDSVEGITRDQGEGRLRRRRQDTEGGFINNRRLFDAVGTAVASRVDEGHLVTRREMLQKPKVCIPMSRQGNIAIARFEASTTFDQPGRPGQAVAFCTDEDNLIDLEVWDLETSNRPSIGPRPRSMDFTKLEGLPPSVSQEDLPNLCLGR